jgi:hypothetical protein
VLRAVSALLLLLWAGAASAADPQLFELAKKVANPIADLTTAPLQYNWDGRIGDSRDGTSNYLRLEPVLPLHLDPAWNVITRLFMPMIEQDDVSTDSGTQYGLSGVNLSFFVSPTAPVSRGLSVGIGPVVGFPASSAALGSQKWGLGPTTAIIWQPSGPWTVGVLTRHLWSAGGPADEPDINETYLQPILNYTTPDAWTLGINSEAFYYWTDDEASVPINVSLTKLVRLGGAALSFGPGVRYWVESPDSDAHGWGFRFDTNLVFPDP